MPITSLVSKELGDLPRSPPALAKNVMALFSLKGKVAAVSGSSNGIGWAVAEAYAQAGADLAIWYNSHPAQDKADYLQRTYGVRAKAYKCNVGDPHEVESTVAQIEEDFGTIDIFVANAGITWKTSACLDIDGYDDFHNMMNINVNGVYYCAKNAGRIFKKNGRGSFIVTASMSGTIVNVPQQQAPYNAAKAACIHLCKSLAVEWAPFARVNSVSPGYTASHGPPSLMDEYQHARLVLTPLGRVADPREMVGAYLYLASDASSYTTGADIIVDGGYSLP